jgi:type I restriction enzyme S subunit
MGDLLEGLKYGTSKKSDYANAGIPILRIPNISAGHVDLTDMKFADLSSREANDLALGATDLLMIRSNGSPHLVGRTAIAGSTAAGMAYAGYLMRLRVDTDVCEPSYLALQLASPYVRRQIEMPLRSTSGVNNINTSEVNGLMIPLAPMAEQREIVRRTDEALACQGLLVGQVESALAAADRRSRSVLAKAFSGRLAGTV